MEKQDIKNILISMRTSKNEPQVNLLLGQIDMMSQEKIDQYLSKIGNSKENISLFLESTLQSLTLQTTEEKTPINKMFTYGINGNCVHLHLPTNLHSLVDSIGFSKTLDTVNLSLLDAINRIKILKNNGFHKFSDITHIYMISPILIGKELKFLNEMNFQTNLYKKSQLQDEKFIKEHSEAHFAKIIFGNHQNIGSASIGFDTLNTPDCEAKYKAKIKEFHEKGIFLEQNEKES